MRTTRRNFLSMAGAVAAQVTLRSVAPSALSAEGLPDLSGLSFRCFSERSAAIDYLLGPQRWDTPHHITVSPADMPKITFSETDAGISIVYGREGTGEIINGVTKDGFYKAVAASRDGVVDLTPQGLRAIGIDILSEDEWKRLAYAQFRSQVLGLNAPRDPFIADVYQKIEDNPLLRIDPTKRPDLVDEILEKAFQRHVENAEIVRKMVGLPGTGGAGSLFDAEDVGREVQNFRLAQERLKAVFGRFPTSRVSGQFASFRFELPPRFSPETTELSSTPETTEPGVGGAQRILANVLTRTEGVRDPVIQPPINPEPAPLRGMSGTTPPQEAIKPQPQV